MKKKIQRHVTLIEIMIVILIIGLITGVLTYNMKGSLDQGKQFKTDQAQQQIENILTLATADGSSMEAVAQSWKEVVHSSPLVAKPHELIKDGWGEPFEVSVKIDERGEHFEIRSKHTK